MGMDDELLLIERRDAIAILTLNNPARLNSLVRPLRDLLATNIPLFVADPAVRAIVITGEGRGFCSGGDFSQPRSPARPATVHREMCAAQGWIGALIGSDTPVVTAVNGAAAGAGFGLAMMGDVVLASDQAFFKAGFPSVGVTPDYLLGWTLPRTVGAIRAFEILTSNRRVSAEEAERIGMVTRVERRDALRESAIEIALGLSRGPYSIGLTKRLIRDAHNRSLEDYMIGEAHAFALATASDDYQAGIDGFREKRAPEFRGC
jgi:2-(1,2-epoxy-1,2-dihydrophenyl)acetyl-CoA isomerase